MSHAKLVDPRPLQRCESLQTNVVSCRFAVELFSPHHMSACDVSVVGAVAGGLVGAAGGQGTLWRFIKACGAAADVSGDKALPCLRRCDHQMVCIEWMPRGPRGLYTRGGDVTGCLSCSSYITLRPCAGWSDGRHNRLHWPGEEQCMLVACTCLF